MKPLTDYSWVRGVNYYQCGEEQLRRELAFAIESETRRGTAK